MKKESKRQRLESLRSQLQAQRSSFLSHWKDLADYILPRRPRFFTQDVNKGDRRNHRIIDNTATLAARTLRSGMMSGITSPARPWFRLTHPDSGMSEIESVKQWLHLVSQRMYTVFLRSNLYNVLPTAYGDLGVFGTSAIGVEEDLQKVVKFQLFPIGSYSIGNDKSGRVSVFEREFQMTVRQIVDEFGRTNPENPDEINWENISAHVKSLYEEGHTETWIDVCHVIEPNTEHDPKRLESKFKAFYSCYYEKGTCGTKANYMRDEGDLFLREKGYDFFPVLVPRWEVTGEDVWGTNCPGMENLGDIKALQLGEKRSAEAIEKKVRPPLVGPASLKNSRVSQLPGDVTFLADNSAGDGLRPLFQVDLSIVDLENKQEQVRYRIKRGFYEDLFLMLATMQDRAQITAREIDERHEEKLLALGPVLEQLNQDLLNPLIDIVYAMMQEQGQIPEPPEEIAGQDLKVEYISVMAQAQKLVGISGYDKLVSFVSLIQPMYPEITDKVDLDQVIDEYSDALGVSPRTIVSDDDVEAKRAGRAQAAQAQAQAEAMQSITQSAKNLSGADMEGDNALSRIVDQAEAGSLVEGGL